MAPRDSGDIKIFTGPNLALGFAACVDFGDEFEMITSPKGAGTETTETIGRSL